MFDPARIDADPRLGTTEIWEFENRSEQPHDVHLHLVQFQQLVAGVGRPPPLVRMGWKDTQRVGPHETASMIVPFKGYSGVYVFHCHMLEHAEHMMMGQFEVVPRRFREGGLDLVGDPGKERHRHSLQGP